MTGGHNSERSDRPDRSIIVTTYGEETAHTQHCLGKIRRWKTGRDEVIVVVHDESPTLRQFLELCCRLRIIDRLVLARPAHGHVRGVNLGFELARADIVFNVCIDMRVGGEIVAECTEVLRSRPNVGLIGWHYDWSADMEGSRWQGGRLEFSLRKSDDTEIGHHLISEHVDNIRAAPWCTGRVFESIGDVRFTCVNGSFFAIRRELWQRLGGFDERLYPVHFADDFLTYAILDQGLDVLNIPRRFRCGALPEEFSALTDLHWQGRHDPYKGIDRVDWTCAEPQSGLSDRENVYLDMLARTFGAETTISMLGAPPWTPLVATGSRPCRYDDPTQLPPSDVILCTADASRLQLTDRLRPGGVLIAFGVETGSDTVAGEQRLDSLRIVRSDGSRAAFKREGTAISPI
jgi:GT2 family glycosyltransferase